MVVAANPSRRKSRCAAPVAAARVWRACSARRGESYRRLALTVTLFRSIVMYLLHETVAEKRGLDGRRHGRRRPGGDGPAPESGHQRSRPARAGGMLLTRLPQPDPGSPAAR